MRARIQRVLFVLAVAWQAAPAAAQSTSATLTGTVYDPQRAVVAGASVDVVSLDTGQPRHTISDKTGNFRIPGLTPGRYEVRVRREGFKEYVQPGLTLAIGDEADLRIDLEIPGLTQTVNVVAETSSTRSPLALGRTFTNRDIDELPVIARDFVSLTLLTPGIFVDRSTGRSQNLTFAASGQNGRNNTLLADGLSLDEHFNGQSRGSFSLDAVKEFMVRPNNFGAEYGQASGAIVSVVTRSGTNQFMGRGFYYRRDDRWNATSPAVWLLDEPGEKNAIQGYAAGGFAGGPIVRDRAFYFGSVEHTARDTEDIITATKLSEFRPEAPNRVPVTFREPQVLGRGDVHLSSRQTLTFRYRLDRIAETNQTADGGPVGLIAPERRHDATRRDQDGAIFANRVLGMSAFNELRFQFARRFVDQEITGHSDGYAENHPGILLGQSPVVPASRTEDRWQLVDTLSWLVPDARGDHAFKTGVDVSVIRADLYASAGFKGIYRFSNDTDTLPATFTINTGSPFSRFDSELYAWFFEDAWKVHPRLTLNLGLRWDYEHTAGVATDRDNVAPRLAVAFRPTTRWQTVLRGGYGIYYDAVLARALNNGQSDFENRTVGNPGAPETSPGPSLLARLQNVDPSVNRLPAVIRTPYTKQASAGMLQPISAFTISSDFVWARGYNLLRTRDLNYPNLEDPGRKRPDDSHARIRVRETEGHSWYRAFLVGVEKRLSRRHSYGIAYTWSRSERDTEDWEFVPNDQRVYGAERGPASNDVRHRVVANLVVDLPFGVRLGTIFSAQSAPPYNITVGSDANRDGEQGPDRPPVSDEPGAPLFGRNSARGDDFRQLDVRLSKQFQWSSRRLEFLIEAFNVTNHTNWTDYDGNKSSETYGRQTAAGMAREIQVGFRIGF